MFLFAADVDSDEFFVDQWHIVSKEWNQRKQCQLHEAHERRRKWQALARKEKAACCWDFCTENGFYNEADGF